VLCSVKHVGVCLRSLLQIPAYLAEGLFGCGQVLTGRFYVTQAVQQKIDQVFRPQTGTKGVFRPDPDDKGWRWAIGANCRSVNGEAVVRRSDGRASAGTGRPASVHAWRPAALFWFGREARFGLFWAAGGAARFEWRAVSPGTGARRPALDGRRRRLGRARVAARRSALDEDRAAPVYEDRADKARFIANRER
jgi:hypothetical protein